MSIYIEEYSENSFVVRGDTFQHKEQLKDLGGRFNQSLKGGPGWIFSNKHLDEVTRYVNDVTGGAPAQIMQTITYKLEKPYVGQKLDLHVFEPDGEKVYWYNVHAIASSEPVNPQSKSTQPSFIDIVDIIPDSGDESAILRMLVVSGKFQVPVLSDEHYFVFV